MNIHGDALGWSIINLVFFGFVIWSIVIYIRTPKHTIKGFIGTSIIVAITGLYVIVNIFFRSTPLVMQNVFTQPPMGIALPIYYLTIKRIGRNTTIFMFIVIIVVLIGYILLLFG